ncbi:NlpC/P60 family protein [uncultured Roseibium sp.]|uniref:NlpC/P60 family protein n=1 Tax=uncultured Roseibium sp. TaxID=1936171 RepID=UPI0026236440|nr:NlpC/P60 family protein [uncultured Roseibium sp.]
MFSKTAIEAAKEHFKSVYPEEGIGYLRQDEFVPMKNIASNPQDVAQITGVEWVSALSDGAECVIHSHTNGKAHPSYQDMVSQIETGLPWGIVVCNDTQAREPFFWGDGVDTQPLVGREFRHGVTDCYSLVRDYFKLKRGVTIPEFPRKDEWWKLGENMYLEGFEKAGFIEIQQSEVRPGDCFLMKVFSDIPNHAGIYYDNNIILHHLSGKLSVREPLTQSWLRRISHWVRFVDDQNGTFARIT